MSRIWYSTSVQSRRLAEQIWVLFFSTFFENNVQNNITCNCMYKYEYFFLFDEIQNQNEIVFFYIFFSSRKLNDRNYEISLSPFFSKMISEGLDLCLQRFLIKEVPKKTRVFLCNNQILILLGEKKKLKWAVIHHLVIDICFKRRRVVNDER